MNEADPKIKQQIVEKIKSSTNILVTVSKNPSVDELSAALGLATILNKLGKHTTAVFSGAMPPAINFLNPDKVFESSVDSLRDFIIALDKEKADHLRYKVDGDVVKIFITPYRTIITGDDLEFSQGDYNVELVLALGVDNQEHLDAALEAHGRILHDVTVATFSAGQQTSQLGSMDWHDEGASGLSEMVTSISEAIKGAEPLLDKQIATALLTGIVAATERFSNNRTSSRVMTMAAQLMAAGADQQLIAAKLQESHEITSLPTASLYPDVTPVIDQPVVAEIEPPIASTLPVETETVILPSGVLDIVREPVFTEPVPASTLADEVSSLQPIAPMDYSTSTLSSLPQVATEPLLGGILNATTDQAAEDARRELEEQQNKTILSHSYLGNQELSTLSENPINGLGQTEDPKTIDIFNESTIPHSEPMVNLPLPPQLPDFSTLPPPPVPVFDTNIMPQPNTISQMQTSTDPAQFKIPGQN